MKNVVCIITGTLILLIAFRCFPNVYAQTAPGKSAVETKQSLPEAPRKTARPRRDFVKTVDFYLRDDEKLVFGKLVSEDKNKITVERREGSKITIATYSKREIDTRTLHIKNIPTAKYYLDLTEYFSGRTWDFRNDPDDFIQAIRCCEKAKQSYADTQSQDSDRIDQINKRIKQLKADREIWTREVESRAKLKKLEFEATIETRLKDLEDNFAASSQKIDKIMADMKQNQQKLENAIADIDTGVFERFEILENEIETNRRIIERIDRTSYYYPRRYRYYP
jgi:hypothetical protein